MPERTMQFPLERDKIEIYRILYNDDNIVNESESGLRLICETSVFRFAASGFHGAGVCRGQHSVCLGLQRPSVGMGHATQLLFHALGRRHSRDRSVALHIIMETIIIIVIQYYILLLHILI